MCVCVQSSGIRGVFGKVNKVPSWSSDAQPEDPCWKPSVLTWGLEPMKGSLSAFKGQDQKVLSPPHSRFPLSRHLPPTPVWSPNRVHADARKRRRDEQLLADVLHDCFQEPTVTRSGRQTVMAADSNFAPARVAGLTVTTTTCGWKARHLQSCRGVTAEVLQTADELLLLFNMF